MPPGEISPYGPCAWCGRAGAPRHGVLGLHLCEGDEERLGCRDYTRDVGHHTRRRILEENPGLAKRLDWKPPSRWPRDRGG
jgi:hypothetical protein